MAMIGRLIFEEAGATLVELGLISALSSVVVVAILTIIGQKERDVFVTISERIVTVSH
jgi:Flp pilus assembly pilin Flp